MLADHVQNLILERDEVGDGKVKGRDSVVFMSRAGLKTNTSGDTTYKQSARCTRRASIKLQEIGQAEGGTSMTCVVVPSLER